MSKYANLLYGGVSFKHLFAKSCIDEIRCAGLPATTELGGTSFVTILPAPTIELGPIVTPGKIILPCPIKQLSLIIRDCQVKCVN